MLHLGLCLGLQVVGDHGAVKMPGDDGLAVWGSAYGDDEGLCGVDRRALVVPEDTHFDLSLGESEEELVVALGRPDHAGHGAVLEELVANGLLLGPLESDLVDEHDVVGLSDGDLLVVG